MASNITAVWNKVTAKLNRSKSRSQSRSQERSDALPHRYPLRNRDPPPTARKPAITSRTVGTEPALPVPLVPPVDQEANAQLQGEFTLTNPSTRPKQRSQQSVHFPEEVTISQPRYTSTPQHPPAESDDWSDGSEEGRDEPGLTPTTVVRRENLTVHTERDQLPTPPPPPPLTLGQAGPYPPVEPPPGPPNMNPINEIRGNNPAFLPPQQDTGPVGTELTPIESTPRGHQRYRARRQSPSPDRYGYIETQPRGRAESNRATHEEPQGLPWGQAPTLYQRSNPVREKREGEYDPPPQARRSRQTRRPTPQYDHNLAAQPQFPYAPPDEYCAAPTSTARPHGPVPPSSTEPFTYLSTQPIARTKPKTRHLQSTSDRAGPNPQVSHLDQADIRGIQEFFLSLPDEVRDTLQLQPVSNPRPRQPQHAPPMYYTDTARDLRSGSIPLYPPGPQQSLPTFGDTPKESWEAFIENWEMAIKKYGLDGWQKAQWLPGSLTGGAAAEGKALILDHPEREGDYPWLKGQLEKLFLRNRPMKALKLYNMAQGRRQVGDYFAEIVSMGKSVYGEIPADFKDPILRDAFINGLRDPYRKKVTGKGVRTLIEAYREAQTLEYQDLEKVDTAKVNAVLIGGTTQQCAADENLRNEVKALQQYVHEQARNQKARDAANPEPPRVDNPRRTARDECHYCGQKGHWKAHCPHLPRLSQPPVHYSQRLPQPRFHNSGFQNQGFQNQGFQPRGPPRGPPRGWNQPPRPRPPPPRYGYRPQGPRNSVMSVTAHIDSLTDDQFAEAMLSQPPPSPNPEHHVTVVNSTRRRRSRGSGASPTSFLNLALIAILGCCLLPSCAAKMPDRIRADRVRANNPTHPMICGSASHDMPHIYRVQREFNCDREPVRDPQYTPQDVELVIYQRNLVEWHGNAYQCKKFRTITTTQMSFWGDIKQKEESTEEDTSVTASECRRMVREKRCDAGQLEGANGVYTTTNDNHAEYLYCCTKEVFSADQCSYIESTVYKRHGVSTFESTAGDVSQCEYEEGNCRLLDGSMLLWETEPESYCAEEEWYRINGSFSNGYFVSDAHDIALTFTEKGLNTATDCKGNVTSRSDQGPMVRFLTPLNNTNISTIINQTYLAAKGDNFEASTEFENLLTILNSLFQAVAVNLAQTQQQLFWASYSFTCSNLVEAFRAISLLMEEHPTVGARYLLGDHRLTAKAGPGFIQVYPCTELKAESYQFLPMGSGNCTAFIPLQISIGGRNRTGYLNPRDNVIHASSASIPCNQRKQVMMNINGTLAWYNHENGTLSYPSNVRDLPFPGIHLSAPMLKIHRTIYSRIHRLDWQQFSQHDDLNELVATLDRQRRVLTRMGIHHGTSFSLEENTHRSRADLLGGSFMAFLFGGQVSSAWEVWTLISNCLVTLACMALIGRCILNRCCGEQVPARVNAITMDVGDQESEGDSSLRRPRTRQGKTQTDRGPEWDTPLSVAARRQVDHGPRRSTDPPRGQISGVFGGDGSGCRQALVRIRIKGRDIEALADAGATITLMNSELAKDLGLELHAPRMSATGVTRDSLDITGRTAALIRLGSHEYKQCIYVAGQISHQVILGTDFLAKLGEVVYDFKHCALRVRGEQLPMGDKCMKRKVRASQDIVVPPFSEVVVAAVVDAPDIEGSSCLFQGDQSVGPKRVIFGKAVDTMTGGEIKVPIINTTAIKQTVQVNTIVGSVEPVNEEQIMMTQTATKPRQQQEEGSAMFGKKPGASLDQSKTNLDDDQMGQLRALLDEFHDVIGESIAELGRTDIVEHVIETEPGTLPIRSKPYNIPVGLKAQVKGQIDEMLQQGLITMATGNWSSPIVLVKKKDNSYRFCVDYRKLNSVTKKQSVCLSSIDSVMEMMNGKKYFSALDLASGFFQIKLHEGSQDKSAFVTPFGTFKWSVMPQGASGSPGSFSRLSMALMADLISEGSSVVYLDDWLLSSTNFEQHLALIRNVFARLRFAGLRYRLTKSFFCQKEITYLGHVVSQEGISVAPHNTEKISKFPRPRDKTEVRRLVGMFGFYRQYVKGYAKIVAPLYTVMSPSTPFEWTKECEEACTELKSRLTSAPILSFPDFSRPFTVTTDASAIGIGAVLSQLDDEGKEHPVSFYSKLLTKAEGKWSSCEQELFAILCAVRHFRMYLMCGKFTILTDNVACTYILEKAHLAPRLARWAVQLADFDYHVQHKEGKSNVVADALSRAVYVAAVEERDEGPVTEEDDAMSQEQARDYFLGPILMYLVKRRFPKDSTKKETRIIQQDSEKFTVIRGVLYREERGKQLLAIPAGKRKALIYAAHDSLMSLHPGIKKTMLKLRDAYWFPHMRREVGKHIQECGSCQAKKNPRIPLRVPLVNQRADSPFEVLSVDYQGPYVESEKGNKHILVWTDHFSKWCEMEPTRDQLATTVARSYIDRIFCRFGASKILISDRAKNFLSELVAEINVLLRVDHRKTTPYHPQTNGQVEIYNKTIGHMLSHVVSENHRDWCEFVPFCQLAHNSSRHTIINASPSLLLLCREMRLPFDITLPELPERVKPGTYAETLHKRMSEVWAHARAAIDKGKINQKKYYDRVARPSDLKVGDAVLYYSPRGYRNRTNKLLKRWKDMYIVKSLTETNAEVQRFDDPDAETVILHLNNLKRYKGPLVRGSASSDLSIDFDLPEGSGSDADTESVQDDEDETARSGDDGSGTVDSGRVSHEVATDAEPSTGDAGAAKDKTAVSDEQDTPMDTTRQNDTEESEHEQRQPESEHDIGNKPEQRTEARATGRYGLRARVKKKREPGFVYSEE